MLLTTAGNETHTIGWHRWQYGTTHTHSQTMTEELDADLVDYLHWGRNLRGLSDNTLRTRLELLQRLTRYTPVPLRHATSDHLLAFENVAIAGRSAETRRAYTCHIRALYRWMLKTGLIDTDPSTTLTLPRVGKHLPRPVPEDDLAVALAAARPKLHAMLTLASYGGLRCCEVAGLEWADIRRDDDKHAHLHVQGKGDKDRLVRVGHTVIRSLQHYGIQKRGAVFLGANGRQITASGVSRAINRHLAHCDIDATAHQLRHRYGTIAYRLSKDPRMVQEQMGHASADTTAIYTLPSAEAAAAMVAAMDALTLPTPTGKSTP